MKIISYTSLHYGASYLGYAIRSIIDHVDEHHILYCPEGSHGHRIADPCPETRDELYTIAQAAAGDKMRWHDGNWTSEGSQRGAMEAYAGDADAVIVLDADEIWPEGLVQEVIQFTLKTDSRAITLPFTHMWRSFHRGFPDDGMHPVRAINPRKISGETFFATDQRVWHYGYAQSDRVVAYKIKIHGHRAEIRPDWYTDIWSTNRQTDCHPVAIGIWNAQNIDLTHLPGVLQNHPYKALDFIP